VYAICSDGDIEEGVSHEVSAIAGHQKLGNLVVIWDDNQISIEDDTSIAKSEDVAARYAAYGWHVQHVDWRSADGYAEDVGALAGAIEAAKAETDRPSFIALRTIIGWPAPSKQNTGKIHGSALGKDEVAATKQILGFSPEQSSRSKPSTVRRAVVERAAARGTLGAISTPGPARTPTAGPCTTG
jgi:transketolase